MKYGLVALCLLAGCSEQPAPVAIPLGSQPPARPEAAQSSDLIVSPHVRRVEHGRAGAGSAPGVGGGGGGGGGNALADWQPRREPPPTEREIAEYRDRMRAEMAERPPEEDQNPCERFLDVMRSNGEATERPGEDPPEGPSRAEMRENCRNMPAAFRDCLSPEYFGAHQSECQEQMERMSARGRRRSNDAERQLGRMRNGQQPWPGQRGAAPARPGDSDDEEEETGG